MVQIRGGNMGHMIQCFIGNPIVIKKIVLPLKQVTTSILDFPQGLQCLFLCDNLFDAIHSNVTISSNNEIEPFVFLDQAIKDYLEMIQPDGYFIYVETDYFGGEGTQISAIFKDGKILETYKENTANIDITIPWPNRLLESPINKALRYIGVIRDGQLDEFDTLGLGKYRHMPCSEI